MKSAMKKTVAVGTLCTLLMGTAAYGTLAYFKEEEKATNTFTSGNFKMDLTETHWEWHEGTQEDGKQIEEWNQATRNQALQYKIAVENNNARWGIEAANRFVPGRTIPKNPAVTVDQGNIPVYVRMTLQVPNTIYGASNLFPGIHLIEKEKVVNFDISSQWKVINEKQDENNTTLIYEYVGEDGEVDKINPEKGTVPLPELFTRIQISEDATSDDLVALGGEKGQAFDIVVNAYGVQADEFENVDAAFEATYPEITK